MPQPAIITRTEAKALSLTRYFTGKPCKWGHVVERYTSGYGCVVCQADDDRKWCKANPNKLLVRRRKARLRNPKVSMIARSKYRAIREGIPHTLTSHDFTIPRTCPVLGIPLVIGVGVPHSGSPSLDRIIPELGYVPGNVEVISHKANAMKQDASAWELFQFSQYYADRVQGPGIPVVAPIQK